MNAIRTLCVFCGSSAGGDARFRQEARRLGAGLARRGIGLVYGGGRTGMMGALAEAALKEGGRVTGIIPEFLMRAERADPTISELQVVASMHERKRRMVEQSDAFCVLPGGMGTLDETFEVLTWKQLGLHAKPIFLVNTAGYWDPWRILTETVVEGGFAHPSTLGLFRMVDRVSDLFALLDANGPTRPQTLV